SSSQIFLRQREIFLLQGGETHRAFKDRAQFVVELGEVGVAHAFLLGRVGESVQAFLTVLHGLIGILCGICAALRGQAAVVIGEQRQRTDVVGIGLQHAVSGVHRLLGIAGLLIGA